MANTYSNSERWGDEHVRAAHRSGNVTRTFWVRVSKASSGSDEFIFDNGSDTGASFANIDRRTLERIRDLINSALD